LFTVGICDRAYGRARHDAPPAARVHDDWAIIARFSLPAPGRFVRQITTFVRETTAPGAATTRPATTC